MNLKELGPLLGVFVVWLVFTRWVLPWFGVETCMSGACRVNPPATVTEEVSATPAQAGEAE